MMKLIEVPWLKISEILLVFYHSSLFGLNAKEDLVNIHIDDLDDSTKPLFANCKQTMSSGEKVYQDDLESKN